jgi:hypothetical protein
VTAAGDSTTLLGQSGQRTAPFTFYFPFLLSFLTSTYSFFLRQFSRMSLQSHIADFNVVLNDNSSDNARIALSRVCANGLAQALSFMSPNSVNYTLQTLSAFCPQARLDVETLSWNPWSAAEVAEDQVERQRVVFFIRARTTQPVSYILECSLWWAERCRDPLVLSVSDHHKRLLELLNRDRRDRVTTLRIQLRSSTICTHVRDGINEDILPQCNRECGNFL